MKDWEEKLNLFLQFNGRKILTNTGKVSIEIAEKLTTEEYNKLSKKYYRKIEKTILIFL